MNRKNLSLLLAIIVVVLAIIILVMVITKQNNQPAPSSIKIEEPKKTEIITITGKYIKGPETQKEWEMGPHIDGVYFLADEMMNLPPGSNSSGIFFFSNASNEADELFKLENEIVDDGDGNVCGFSGKATIEVSDYNPQGDESPISNDSAKLNKIIKKEPYKKKCFNIEK